MIQAAIALGIQASMLFPPDPIDRVPQQLGDVELVDHDPLVGLLQVLRGG